MKNLLKKSMGIMLAAIVAMQGMTAFAATKTYKDGDIELCQPSEIYVNEDFNGASLPATDTGNATWKFSNQGAVPDNGQLYLQGGVSSSAELKTNTPLAGVGNKYVLSFDIGKDEFIDRAFYFLKMGNNNGVLFFGTDANTETYTARVGSASAGNINMVTGIKPGQMINYRVDFTIGEAGFIADVTITDVETGTVLKSVEDVTIEKGYNADIGGVDSFYFYNTTGNSPGIMLDNVKLYKYLTAPEVPVVPEEPEEDALTSLDVARYDEELAAKDGDFALCKDADIYANEDFSGKVPSGKTENGLASWGIWSNVYIENGCLNLDSTNNAANSGNKKGALVFDPALSGVGNKYVLDYDFCFKNQLTVTKASPVYFFYLSDNKNVMWTNVNTDGSYAIRIGGGTAGNYTVTKTRNHLPGEIVNIKMIMTVTETGLVADVTLTDTATGDVLGSVKNFSIGGYDATAKGIKNFYWGYNAFDMSIDNVKFYNYCTVPEPTKIVEADIPGVPVVGESGYIANETFDDIDEIANKSTDADGTYWTCPGGTTLPMVNMVSGRKAMKIVPAGWLTVSPKGVKYNSEEGANNTYVLKFGVKNFAGYNGETSINNDFMRVYYDANGVEKRYDGVIQYLGNVIRASTIKLAEVENKWYTVAAVFELGADKTDVTLYVLDGNKVYKSPVAVLAGMNNIKYFRFGAVTNPAYIDNLQVYAAGDKVTVGETPEVTLSNVKFTAVGEEISLSNVPANSGVTMTADVAFANEKPVEFIPQGIMAAYKKLSDGSLQLVSADIVNLASPKYNVALFKSDSEGGEYVVKLYSLENMDNIKAVGEALELGK